MTLKSRGNYPSGGWCPERAKCANDGKRCNKCIIRDGRKTEFKKK